MWEEKYKEIQPVKHETAIRMIGPQPIIPNAFSLYLDTFRRLHSERHIIAGAVAPIPITKIMHYGEWIEYEDMDRFVEIIQELDAYFISLVLENINKQIKAG